ncbi:MAG: hypothetical protein R3Y64_10170, partial [Peptostreptococcaceae bacterium]
ICIMIFMMIFCFMYDLILLTYKQYRISEETTSIARQISNQSGVLNSTPRNFPGGDGSYNTTAEIRQQMQGVMDGLYLKNWTMVVRSNSGGYANIASGNANLITEYREPITVEVTFQYNWTLWDSFLGTPKTITMNISRSGFSEYNHDFYNDY